MGSEGGLTLIRNIIRGTTLSQETLVGAASPSLGGNCTVNGLVGTIPLAGALAHSYNG